MSVMKRRQFLTMAGATAAATVVAGVAVSADEKPNETRKRLYESGNPPTCEECVYWAYNPQAEPGFGRCHRRSLEPSTNSTGMLAVWEWTRDNAWCGEYVWRKDHFIRIGVESRSVTP